jgi:hypothetical protein
MREEPDRVAVHTAAFLCFAAPSCHRVEPLFSDAFTVRPPLTVGDHRVSPVSCGAQPSSRGRVSSLARSPPFPCTPPRRRADAGDAGHHFLQVSPASFRASVDACPIFCFFGPPCRAPPLRFAAGMRVPSHGRAPAHTCTPPESPRPGLWFPFLAPATSPSCLPR